MGMYFSTSLSMPPIKLLNTIETRLEKPPADSPPHSENSLMGRVRPTNDPVDNGKCDNLAALERSATAYAATDDKDQFVHQEDRVRHDEAARSLR